MVSFEDCSPADILRCTLDGNGSHSIAYTHRIKLSITSDQQTPPYKHTAKRRASQSDLKAYRFDSNHKDVDEDADIDEYGCAR